MRGLSGRSSSSKVTLGQGRQARSSAARDRRSRDLHPPRPPNCEGERARRPGVRAAPPALRRGPRLPTRPRVLTRSAFAGRSKRHSAPGSCYPRAAGAFASARGCSPDRGCTEMVPSSRIVRSPWWSREADGNDACPITVGLVSDFLPTPPSGPTEEAERGVAPPWAGRPQALRRGRC